LAELEFELPSGVSVGRAVDLSRDVQDQQEMRFKCFTQVTNTGMCLQWNLVAPNTPDHLLLFKAVGQGVWRRKHGLFSTDGNLGRREEDRTGKRSRSKLGPAGA
jgi:hypothetical protein